MSARFLFSALVLLSLAACNGKSHGDQWPLSKEELERNASAPDPAEATYRRYCIGCHGVDGKGNGGSTGADFTLPNGPLQKPEDELFASVRDGRRGERATMPAHKPVLSEAQIRAVIGYVKQRFAAH